MLVYVFMLKYERRRQTLEVFAQRVALRPPEYAQAAQFFPIRLAYTYLKRLHKNRYLNRGRDYRGRLLYSLSPRGAEWLLKKRRGW